MQSVIKRKQLIKALNNDSVLCYDTDDNMILVCQALLITTAEHGFFCGSLKSFCFLLDGRLFFINILNTSNGVPQCLLIGAERNREPPRCMVSVIGTWIVYIRKFEFFLPSSHYIFSYRWKLFGKIHTKQNFFKLFEWDNYSELLNVWIALGVCDRYLTSSY